MYSLIFCPTNEAIWNLMFGMIFAYFPLQFYVILSLWHLFLFELTKRLSEVYMLKQFLNQVFQPSTNQNLQHRLVSL